MKDNYIFIYIVIGLVMLCFAENNFYDQVNKNQWLNSKSSENFSRLYITTIQLYLSFPLQRSLEA